MAVALMPHPMAHRDMPKCQAAGDCVLVGSVGELSGVMFPQWPCEWHITAQGWSVWHQQLAMVVQPRLPPGLSPEDQLVWQQMPQPIGSLGELSEVLCFNGPVQGIGDSTMPVSVVRPCCSVSHVSRSKPNASAGAARDPTT